MTAERKKILEPGFEGYLAKPVRAKEFTEDGLRALNARLDMEVAC